MRERFIRGETSEKRGGKSGKQGEETRSTEEGGVEREKGIRGDRRKKGEREVENIEEEKISRD